MTATEPASLPHESYVDAVWDALADLGYGRGSYWYETPDGEQLDAVVRFGSDVSPDEWPDGVFLGWDQRAGWSLTSTGSNRNLFPLDLGTYANPRAVAARTATRLKGAADEAVNEEWDGASALAVVVAEWEADR